MSATFLIVLWALAFVFFVICEIATGTALVSIWFAFGALAAMFCAIGEMSFLIQCVVFVVGSIILLICTRPIAKKLRGKVVPTNYELDVGKTAIVTEEIDNKCSRGRVVLNGTNWAARSVDGSVIPKDETVKVQEIDGSKLIVSRI
ncbi:MAG: NfeD family protein [Hominimerdicola sp.]